MLTALSQTNHIFQILKAPFAKLKQRRSRDMMTSMISIEAHNNSLIKNTLKVFELRTDC